MRPPGPPQHGPPHQVRFPGPGNFVRPGRPLTYGEYRKMRLEHEKAVTKWQQQEESRLQQQQQPPQQQEQPAQKSETEPPPKGPSIYDVRKNFGNLDPLPPCPHLGLIYSTKFTQPPLLHLLLG